jgi:hypothetical protein
VQTVILDQRSINKSISSDTLVSLGTFEFAKGNSGYVRLGDATGIKNDVIVLDAMMWKYRGAAVTSVPSGDLLPGAFGLTQNYPNPFNPSTDIAFSLPAPSHVSLVVFDLLGRRIASLADGPMNEGIHHVRWDPDTAPGGVYFCRLTVRGSSPDLRHSFTDVKKMLYTK